MPGGAGAARVPRGSLVAAVASWPGRCPRRTQRGRALAAEIMSCSGRRLMKPPRVLHEASLRPQPRCKGPGKRGELGGGRTRVRPRHDPVSPAAAHPDGAVAAASFSPLAPRLPPSACYFGMGPPQHCPGGAGAPRGALQHQREGAGGSQRTLLGCRGGMWQSQGHPCPLPWLSMGRGARRGWGGPCRISPSGVR